MTTSKQSSLSDRLLEVPFSALCWVSAFGLMIGTSLVSVLAYPFRSPAEQSLWSARAFRPVLGITRSRLRVHYAPGFDDRRPSVFCFNHVNVLDAHTACAVIPQPFVGLMLAWHFHIPGYGWMMRATHGIPVHPRSAGRTDELVAHAKDRLANGLSILAYPEGHRTRDGKVGPYKRGLFFMARNVGMPIVPVAVRGMYEVNRKGSFIIRPGEVSVYVGAQIETAGLDDEAIARLASAVQERVADYVEGRDSTGAGFDTIPSFETAASA
jgi:1-acyl-sn-glycerol-3-phosphate acyltransferase